MYMYNAYVYTFNIAGSIYTTHTSYASSHRTPRTTHIHAHAGILWHCVDARVENYAADVSSVRIQRPGGVARQTYTRCGRVVQTLAF